MRPSEVLNLPDAENAFLNYAIIKKYEKKG
jgi:hypothetical protein